MPQTSAESYDDPLSSFNEHIWTAPPKQRRPVRRDADKEFIQKLVIAVVVMVCSGAIVVPLGIVAYFVYKGYASASEQMAQNSPPDGSSTSTYGTDYQPGVFNPRGSATSPPVNPNSQDNTETANGTSAFAELPGGAQYPTMTQHPTMTQPQTNPQTNPGSATGGGFPPPGRVMPNEYPPNVGSQQPDFNNPSGPPSPGPMSPRPMTPGPSNPGQKMGPQRPGSTQPNVTVVPGSSGSVPGLSENLRKFSGKDGVFIFVVGSQSAQVGQAINQLTDALSINDRAVEVQSDHTVIGLRYSGPLDNVSKNFRYGRISYIDEDSRTIHVQGN